MTLPLRNEDYKIAWIAILPVEVEAAVAALDVLHKGHFTSKQNDDYTYIAGEINGHNIVIAKPPAGQNYGPGTAAALASHVKTQFPIWFALLVGVAAGLPNLATKDPNRYRDIRLGDVLVCMPDKTSTGLVHYDLGTDTDAGFRPNGRQAETPSLVRSAIGSILVLKKAPFRENNDLALLLDNFNAKADDRKFDYPGQDHDELFESAGHFDELEGDDWLLVRRPRDESEPTQVWYGNIGSGGAVMRNASKRDQLRDTYNLIGLEMEAAGVMNILPTGVVRGVCDYGDAYKTKQWQPYAAAVAAVYAKAILLEIKPEAICSPAQAPRALKFPGQPNATAYRYPLPRDSMSYFGKQLKEQSGRFRGRRDVLDILHTAVETDQKSESKKIIALSGFGGIGKTEILLEYGLMARRSNHIFYCQAVPGQTFEMCMANLANAVGSEMLQSSVELSVREEVWNSYSAKERINAFFQWLRCGPEGSSLILFDDIDAFKDDDNHETLSVALRGWPHTVLLTTRDPNLGNDLAAESSREVDDHCIEGLDEDELIPIMRQFMSKQFPFSPTELSIIAKFMKGHVMAACRAVQFISQVLSLSSDDPVQQFVASFESDDDNCDIVGQFLNFQPRPGRSLATCFETSIQRLGGLECTAIQILDFAAYTSSPDIDFRTVLRFRSPWLARLVHEHDYGPTRVLSLSDAELRDALKRLVTTGLLIRTTRKLTVHHLLQEYLFHKHGHRGRILQLKQIKLLLFVMQIDLGDDDFTVIALHDRCQAILSRFGIHIAAVVPPLALATAVRSRAVENQVGVCGLIG